MTDDEINRGLEAWKVTVEVQKHFNDIEMKIRNYALALLLAVAAAAGVALRENRPGLAIWILIAGFMRGLPSTSWMSGGITVCSLAQLGMDWRLRMSSAIRFQESG